jgi:DNA polymerase-3 subunit delta'
VAAGSHPDVDYVARPVGKSVIPIELLIGDREHRSQQGLCHRLALKPASGRRRIAIIDDADWMNQEGANCLLKTLEEPPPKSLVILIGTSLQRQLPTIRSRCQIVRFRPLPPDFVRQFAIAAEWCQGDAAALELADLSEGSLDRAREFAEPDLRPFADQLAELWSQALPDTIEIAKQIQTFVDSGGRDAPQRRSRLRQLVELMIWRLRREILATVRSQTSDPGSQLERGQRLEVADSRLDRCLSALQEIDANANMATLIECWVDDLGQAPFRGAPRFAAAGRQPTNG